MLHPLVVFGQCSIAADGVLRKVAGIDLAGNCVHEVLTRTRFGIGDYGAPLDARIDSRLTGFDGASSIWIVGSSECSTIRSSNTHPARLEIKTSGNFIAGCRMGMLAMATGSVKISHSFSKGSHSSSAISAKRRVHSARYFATWRGHGSEVNRKRVYAAWANCSPKRLRYSVGLIPSFRRARKSVV